MSPTLNKIKNINTNDYSLFLINGFNNDPQCEYFSKNRAPISDQGFHHIETSQLIFSADPLIRFCMQRYSLQAN